MQDRYDASVTDYSEKFYKYVEYFGLIYHRGLINAQLCVDELQDEKRACNSDNLSVIATLNRTFSDFGKAILQHGK